MFLHEHKQFVTIKGSNSQFGSVRSGVPQGSVQESLLLVFNNDVLEGINCNATRFADDRFLYTEVNNLQDQVNLNGCSKTVKEWCNKW